MSERRVNQYITEGRIPGAERFGRSWAIPEDAVKPIDPRKKETNRGDNNRDAYTNAKTEFIRKWTAEARMKYVDRYL